MNSLTATGRKLSQLPVLPSASAPVPAPAPSPSSLAPVTAPAAAASVLPGIALASSA